MRVVIAGGHGQIALLLGERLAAAGHDAVGLVRNPGHAGDLEARGMHCAVVDLENTGGPTTEALVAVVKGADAVVFAAGAGPGSGPARKRTMDRDGAIRLMDACRETGVRRYVMVSAMGARPGAERGEGDFSVYLQAKADADAALTTSGLHYTIVRPGRLTDDPGTGRVTIAPQLPRGEIPRADVAAVIATVLETARRVGDAFDLVSGETPIEEAL
jgi:uncharacterized protein YbjT (DUF2867 family)